MHNKWVSAGIFVITLFAALFIAGCSEREPEKSLPDQISIMDPAGREVTLSYPVERIVVTDDTVADLVQILGAEEKVVGIEGSISSRGYFSKMSEAQVVGNQWQGLNWEKIVELNPDVIFISDHPACTPKITKKAQELGIPVVTLRWRFPEDQVKSATIAARILRKERRCEKFIQWRNRNLDIIRERLEGMKENDKLKSYLEVDFSGPIGSAAGKGKPGGQTMEAAGLRNICEFERNKEVDAEWILEKNPDMIIMCDYAGGAGGITGYKANDSVKLDSYVSEVTEREKFNLTNAVENNNVYVMNTKLRGSMHVLGVLYMAKAAYPERFKGIDPEKVHKEFFEEWLGKDFKGIWFYPQTWK